MKKTIMSAFMLFVSIGLYASEESNFDTHRVVTLSNGDTLLVQKSKVRAAREAYLHRLNASPLDEEDGTPLSRNDPQDRKLVIQDKVASQGQSSQPATEVLPEDMPLPRPKRVLYKH